MHSKSTLLRLRNFPSFCALHQPTKHQDPKTNNTQPPRGNATLRPHPPPIQNEHSQALKKTKIIGKQQKKLKSQRKVSYKYFRRKIFPQNTPKTQRPLEVIRLYDWMMEASTTLHLPRDVFYMALSILRKIVSAHFLRNSPEKTIESFVAASLSLSAKLDNNQINFPDALDKITDHRIDKLSIIEAQLSIMKKLNFSLPLQAMIYGDLVGFCCQWHRYIVYRGEDLRIDPTQLMLDDSLNIDHWSPSSRRLFEAFVTLFDGIVMHSNQCQPHKNTILNPLSFCLFAIMNARVHEFFPMNPTDRTILVLLFHEFLTEKFGYGVEDLQGWMHELIRLRQRLRIVDVVDGLLGGVPTHHEMTKIRYVNVLDWK